MQGRSCMTITPSHPYKPARTTPGLLRPDRRSDEGVAVMFTVPTCQNPLLNGTHTWWTVRIVVVHRWKPWDECQPCS